MYEVRTSHDASDPVFPFLMEVFFPFLVSMEGINVATCRADYTALCALEQMLCTLFGLSVSTGRAIVEGSADMAKGKEDQRAEIQFCVRLGMSRTEIHRHLTAAHGAQTLSKSQINRWMSRISADPGVTLKDKPQTAGGWKLTAAKLAQIHALVQADRRITTWRVAAATGLSNGCAHKALRKCLQMTKKSAKWIPHLLTNAQCVRRQNLARQALQCIRRRGNQPHIITGDSLGFGCGNLSPSSRQGSGSKQLIPVQQRCDRSSPRRNACWSLFLMSLEWFTDTGYLKGMVWIDFFIAKWWSSWERQWGGVIPSSGELKTGVCCMTMPPPIPLIWLWISSETTMLNSCPTLGTAQTCRPATTGCSHNWKKYTKMASRWFLGFPDDVKMFWACAFWN